MTIYAEELRIMMDAIMDIIFDHGTHRQARTFMAVFTLDAEHPYPDGVLPHLVRIFTTDHTRQFLKRICRTAVLSLAEIAAVRG